MNTTHTRRNRITAAIGAAIVGATVSALLLLSADTAQAIEDVSEHGGIAILDNLPLPRDCGNCGGFNPQPDPPGNPDPSTKVGIGNPNDAGVGNPNEAGVGNPNDRPSQTVDPTNPNFGAGPHVNGVN